MNFSIVLDYLKVVGVNVLSVILLVGIAVCVIGLIISFIGV